MLTVEYRCADGTAFPVTFESAEQAALPWRYDREHLQDAATPLSAATARLGFAGSERAFHEMGLLTPIMFRPGPEPHGFSYFCEAPIPDDDMAKLVAGCAALLEKWGSAEGIWRDCSLPIVKRSCQWLDEAGDDVPVARLAEEQAYAWAHTMVSVFVSGNDIDLLTAVCEPVHGEAARMVAHELAQGYPNETVRADQCLWELGQMVVAEAALGAALAANDPKRAMAELRSGGVAPEFFEAFDRFLDDFGARAESWDISAPTWNELGPGFWAQLRQMARPDVVPPDEALAKAAQRREVLVAETEAALDGDDQRARFRRRVARVASYVAVREERALWQLTSSGCLRGALLRRGERLAAGGVIDAVGDVLYLLPEEIDDPSGSLHAVVAERRADHEYWMTKEPPPMIGGEGASDADRDAPGAGAGAAAATADGSRVLRGVAASRGVVTGPARVVTSLADADRVEPGDVLVCVMTAPPWTPLFGIVSAVIADSGGLGSHPAIAAREYGIPCVLGVRGATAMIPDGATVTVDGAAGTVTLE